MLRVIEHSPHHGPRMESYFDEVTETTPVRCPITNEIVMVTLLKEGGLNASEIEDVSECPYFDEEMPTCHKGCVGHIGVQ